MLQARPPATAYGNVYVGLDSTRFLALNQATGGLVWSFNTPSGSNATSPAIYNGVVYFGTGRGIVYARNATTGVQIWSYTTPSGGAVTSSPALALGSNALFFGSNDRYLYALNSMTGALLWRYLLEAFRYEHLESFERAVDHSFQFLSC